MRTTLFLLLLPWLLFIANEVWATPWTFTVRAENDFPANSDRYYSNGIALSFAQCIPRNEVLLTSVLRLPGFGEGGVITQGFDLGQIMVTPADTSLRQPDPRDRPYAGLLYAGLTWQHLDADRFAALKVITGVVGPSSLAEQTQRDFHKLIDAPISQGWDYQLRDEPILNLVYERRWRTPSIGSEEGFGGDAVLVSGGMLGNILTQAYGHGQLRAGWRVPKDFGTSLIRGIGVVPPARGGARWSGHVFVGAGGFAVARNITLDGNTWRASPSVQKKSWVPAAEVGLVLRGPGWQTILSWVSWGREFDGQSRYAEFGTLAFSILR